MINQAARLQDAQDLTALARHDAQSITSAISAQDHIMILENPSRSWFRAWLASVDVDLNLLGV